MKRIYLKKLSLSNFKGIKNLEIDFESEKTDICGDNGTGKTTVFDGFTWLLFGKDHLDNSKFEIKTLDTLNNAIPKLEHEVEAELLVDGEKIVLRRTYKEKWVKQRGSVESVLTGHETSYHINNVPQSMSEYQAKIGLLIDEQMFKLLTNPLRFNSLEWKSRREILTGISSIISDEEIAIENVDFVKILQEASGKPLEDFKREINASKKKLRSELDEIPTRIDELYKSLPEEQDWDKLKKEVAELKNEAEIVVQQIIDNSKVDDTQIGKIKYLQQQVYGQETLKSKIESDARNVYLNAQKAHDEKVYQVKQKIQLNTFELQKFDRQLEHEISERRKYEADLSKLRIAFDKRQEELLETNDDHFACPTCKRDFEPHKIADMQEEMRINFNTAKATDLENINATGKLLKAKFEKAAEIVKDYEFRIVDVKNLLDSLGKELSEIENGTLAIAKVDLKLDEYADYHRIVESIEKFTTEIETLRNEVTKKDVELLKSLEARREEIRNLIESNTRKLYNEEQIKQGNARIKILEDRNSILGQELADLEKKEFAIDQFLIYKMNKIEESVNSLFPTVKFKMFCTQLNGGTADCCETLVNGVPFDNANNAAKIQAGIEIINVLANYYQFSAPIFVDNAESVVRLPITNSQLIRLIVSENYKCLTVN